jgi:Fe-S-cluster containining protein
MLFEALKPSSIFICRQCGDCCKGYGGTVISDEDIYNISNYINADPHRFVADYCQSAGTKMVLAQRSDGYCIFWNGLCTIHPVKPYMCKAWPFIRSISVDVNNWHIMAALCPGMRTDVPDRVIKECVDRALSRNGSSICQSTVADKVTKVN